MPKTRSRSTSDTSPGVAVGVVVLLVAVVAFVGWVVLRDPAPPQTGDGRKAAAWMETHTPEPEPKYGDALVDLSSLPEKPKVVIIGDSWTQGYGAVPETKGYAYELTRRLGWDSTIVPNGSGTGFVNPGEKGDRRLAARLRTVPADDSVDLVVVEGGVNDARVTALFDSKTGGVTPKFDQAVDRFLAVAKKRYPNAKIVMIGPLNMVDAQLPPLLASINNELLKAANRAGAGYVSPATGGWFNSKALLDQYASKTAPYHPNTEGYAYYTDQLVETLKTWGLGGG